MPCSSWEIRPTIWAPRGRHGTCTPARGHRMRARRITSLGLLLTTLSMGASALADGGARPGVHSREAAWLLGQRFAGVGLGSLEARPLEQAEAMTAFARLFDRHGRHRQALSPTHGPHRRRRTADGHAPPGGTAAAGGLPRSKVRRLPRRPLQARHGCAHAGLRLPARRARDPGDALRHAGGDPGGAHPRGPDRAGEASHARPWGAGRRAQGRPALRERGTPPASQRAGDALAGCRRTR